MALPRTLIDPKRIYLEPGVRAYERGREVLARYPDAELVEVASHWKIPELFADRELASDWLRMKREVLVLGVKKGLSMRPNGRSADFIAPSSSNGCAMACSYCYVARRRATRTESRVFVNIDEIAASSTGTPGGSSDESPAPNSIDPGRTGCVPTSARTADLSLDCDGVRQRP
jgi:hypothetical protein